ncbi:hypothetical protein ACIP25_21910 [Streptomyces massasporeus]|uniref:hypothetical protein n=1 Tax=Streptomyces massasporeus TaxID=67324 RepID=UPI003804D425
MFYQVRRARYSAIAAGGVEERMAASAVTGGDVPGAKPSTALPCVLIGEDGMMGIMKSLAAAGLRIVDGGGTEPDGLIPPIVTGQAPSCPPEEGRVEAMLDVLEPQLLERANADWYRLSVEGGLFSETDRRFLLALGLEEGRPSRWFCVELQSEWDIMGKGAAACSAARPAAPSSACSHSTGTSCASRRHGSTTSAPPY